MRKRRRKTMLWLETVLAIVMPIVLILLFAEAYIFGPRRPREYEFAMEMDQIKMIGIVERENQPYEERLLIKEIKPERWEKFWTDFREVKCTRKGPDPDLGLSKIGICVTYEDESIEILTWRGCIYIPAGEDENARGNWYHFDKDEFYAFLSKYVEDYNFSDDK